LVVISISVLQQAEVS